jgi:hypothetical protein
MVYPFSNLYESILSPKKVLIEISAVIAEVNLKTSRSDFP